MLSDTYSLGMLIHGLICRCTPSSISGHESGDVIQTLATAVDVRTTLGCSHPHCNVRNEQLRQ